MRRKDLNVGDRFRYIYPPASNLNFIVIDGEIGVPEGWSPSDKISSQSSLEDEVILIDEHGKPVGGVPDSNQEELRAGGSSASGESEKPDSVSATSPPHYHKLSPEPIDVIESWNLNFRLANVIKYIARAGNKPGASTVEDLRKGLRYLKREIAAQEGRRAWE